MTIRPRKGLFAEPDYGMAGCQEQDEVVWAGAANRCVAEDVCESRTGLRHWRIYRYGARV